MAGDLLGDAESVPLSSVTMETVAFYSYKGGVGRTLLVSNTAEFLAISGRRIVALDLDLEATGLHQKLMAGQARERSSREALRGAVDELLATVSGTKGDATLAQNGDPSQSAIRQSGISFF